MRASRNWWHISLAAVLVAATFGFTVSADEPKAAGADPATLRTATVTRGDLVATVNATGTVEPEEVVDVGAQVVGRVTSFGADPHSNGKSIDYGSVVEEGTLLAQIDDAMYVAQVEQARGGCQCADAELAQAKAKLALAKAECQRAQDQIKSKSISAFDLDVAKRTYEVAQAAIAVAEATSARSKAALKQAEISLSCTRIRSPIKGVIIDRRVNVGQTVVAGLNAPSLFLIAKDLKKLQVWVSVNEADVGKIREKQAVRFTVDAYPGKFFEGKVGQIRLNAALTQNVVTYTVVVATDNASEKLLPYLTANVQFEVGRRNNVLLVPNAALRWRPQPQWIAADVREKTPLESQKPGGREARPGEKTRPRQEPHRVWVQDGRFVRPIAVEIGLTDGTMTEIVVGDVSEGVKIIVGGGLTMTDVGRSVTAGPPSIASQLLQLPFTYSASKKAMQQAVASMGTNQLLILPGTAAKGGVSFGSGSTTMLTPEDADEIARRCPAVSHVAPIVRVRAQIVYGNRNWVPYMINGATPSFLSVRDWEELAEGAAFTDADVRNVSKVCLIGETLKRELFQGESPIGKEIRIQNVAFKVVGVLSRKGANFMGMDQDDVVLAPWTTIKYRVSGLSGGTVQAAASKDTSNQVNTLNSLSPGSTALYPAQSATQAADTPQPIRFVTVDQILVKAASAEQIPLAMEQIKAALRERHHIRPGQDDDFNIRDMTELIKAIAPRWW
jgi:HlyD family secretion protein